MQPLLAPAQIAVIVDDLAKKISSASPDITSCVVLMDGAMIFAADLLRALYGCGLDPKTYSLRLSSYGADKVSSGQVRITADIEADLTGDHVLIIDDVLDSGKTLEFARDHLLAKGARKVSTCVFACKPYAERKMTADYFGWSAPDAFLVGYGLDDACRLRGLPGIFAVS